MRPRLVTLLTVGLALLPAPLALAQSSGVSFVIGGGGRVVAQRNYDLTVSGDVRVTFRGDPGAGCAAHGVCGYSGTAIWKPAARANAALVVIRSGHRLIYYGLTAFTNTLGVAGEIVHHGVPEASAGGCADASTPEDPLTITTRGNKLRLAPDVSITSRCAGPLGADLAAVAPGATVSAGAFTHPRLRVDLSGTRTFTVHGFTGTVASTIIITGRRQRNQTNGSTPPPGHRHRIRLVTESLTVVHASGMMQTLITGTRDGTVCSLLDSCGAQGTISWPFVPKSASGQLYATGPATLPLKAYRIALGIEPGRADRRIGVFGGVDWDEGGRVHESISQAGASCNDTTPAVNGGVELSIVAGALRASYGTSTDGRTRCPGPELNQSGSTPLSGTMALKRTHGQFSLHLAGRASHTDDGYELRQSGSLTLTLRRGRITQRIESY